LWDDGITKSAARDGAVVIGKSNDEIRLRPAGSGPMGITRMGFLFCVFCANSFISNWVATDTQRTHKENATIRVRSCSFVASSNRTLKVVGNDKGFGPHGSISITILDFEAIKLSKSATA